MTEYYGRERGHMTRAKRHKMRDSGQMCINCKQYRGNFTCIDFPKGIPEDIVTVTCDKWEENMEQKNENRADSSE
jgi:hypothetical protein